MKKYLPHITITLTIIMIMVGFPIHATNASWTSAAASLIGFSWDSLGYIASWIVTVILYIAAWFVTLTGFLLNVSLNITMHIKDFVNSTPAIYDVWRIIRDISGIFMIFALLYAAIQLIIGYKKSNFGDLIKNIVIAGVLINFSFFFTSVMIDASNMVSLSIYNAIVPVPTEKFTSTGDMVSETAFNSSQGISSILMNALQVQRTFDPKTMSFQTGGTAAGMDPIKVILTGITGVAIMFTTGMSFLFASLAFIIRLVILLGLLAFSPLWFAAQVIPQLQLYSKKWWDMLYGQLIFMPVYLLLMYVALYIINSTKIFHNGASGNLWQGIQTSGVPTEYITFAINSAFIIIMLDLPLLAALKLGAGAGIIDGFGKKINAFGVWKGVGSQAGSRTLGRSAYALNNSKYMRSAVAALPTLGGLVSKQVSKVSNAGFGVKKGGYEDRMKEKAKIQEGVHKSIGGVDRNNYETEEEYNEAKKQAGKYQERYRANLPLANGSVLGFMLDNRVNKQTSRSLSEEANVDVNNIKLKQVSARIKELQYMADSSNPDFRILTNEEVEELRHLRRDEEELKGAVDRGRGSKKKKDNASIIKTIIEESGAKTEGEEKPKDKPESEKKP